MDDKKMDALRDDVRQDDALQDDAQQDDALWDDVRQDDALQDDAAQMDAQEGVEDGTYEAIAFSGHVLAPLFLKRPNVPEIDAVLVQLAVLDSMADWPFGNMEVLDDALSMIKSGMADPLPERVTEYNRLFIGPGHIPAPAYGSVYLDRESVLFGDSTLELRAWMRANGIKNLYTEKEPEDHIGRMLDMMAGLAEQRPDLLTAFLGEHLMPWAPRYLELLEQSAEKDLYRGVARLTAATLDGIRDALDVVVHKRRLYY